MAQRDITYYVLDTANLWPDTPNDVVKNASLIGTEIDNNFHVLEGRDIRTAELTADDKLVLKTYDPNGYITVDLSRLDGGQVSHATVSFYTNGTVSSSTLIDRFYQNQTTNKDIALPIFDGKLKFKMNGSIITDGSGNEQSFSANESNDVIIDLGTVLSNIRYSDGVVGEKKEVGRIYIGADDTTGTAVNIPKNVSAFSNDAQYITGNDISYTGSASVGYEIGVVNIDGTEYKIVIPLFSSDNLQGIVSATAGDANKFLRGDGVWAEITTSVEYAGTDFSGRETLSLGEITIDGNPEDIEVPVFEGSGKSGIVQSTAADAGKVLKSDGTWTDGVASVDITDGVLSFIKFDGQVI